MQYNSHRYWDQVEADLETSLDIIDDLFGEAEGVMQHNPWINYGNPLQVRLSLISLLISYPVNGSHRLVVPQNPLSLFICKASSSLIILTLPTSPTKISPTIIPTVIKINIHIINTNIWLINSG